MTHPTRAFSGSIINRFTGSKILARVGQISVAFPTYINLFVTQQSVQTFALAKLYFQREKSVKSLCPQLSLHPTQPIM